MSRSYKEPIIRDSKFTNYHRLTRKKQNMQVRDIHRLTDIESYEIEDAKIILNDYSYRDYTYTDYNNPKLRRK